MLRSWVPSVKRGRPKVRHSVVLYAFLEVSNTLFSSTGSTNAHVHRYNARRGFMIGFLGIQKSLAGVWDDALCIIMTTLVASRMDITTSC